MFFVGRRVGVAPPPSSKHHFHLHRETTMLAAATMPLHLIMTTTTTLNNNNNNNNNEEEEEDESSCSEDCELNDEQQHHHHHRLQIPLAVRCSFRSSSSSSSSTTTPEAAASSSSSASCSIPLVDDSYNDDDDEEEEEDTYSLFLLALQQQTNEQQQEQDAATATIATTIITPQPPSSSIVEVSRTGMIFNGPWWSVGFWMGLILQWIAVFSHLYSRVSSIQQQQQQQSELVEDEHWSQYQHQQHWFLHGFLILMSHLDVMIYVMIWFIFTLSLMMTRGTRRRNCIYDSFIPITTTTTENKKSLLLNNDNGSSSSRSIDDDDDDNDKTNWIELGMVSRYSLRHLRPKEDKTIIHNNNIYNNTNTNNGELILPFVNLLFGLVMGSLVAGSLTNLWYMSTTTTTTSVMMPFVSWSSMIQNVALDTILCLFMIVYHYHQPQQEVILETR